MIKYCECCGKEIELPFGSTKYCKKCSLYIYNINKERYSLKQRLIKKDKRIKKLESQIILKNDSSMHQM